MESIKLTNTLENKKERNSSLELLRIIAMLLIIAHHYVVHGGFSFDFSNNAVSVAYLKIISMFGKSACSIFALITGYFMISIDTKKGFYRKIIPLLFKMLFCSLIVFFVVYIFGGECGVKDLIRTLMPLFFGNNWYVKTYVAFYFFIPFINQYLLSIDKKRYQQLLILIMCIYLIANTISLNQFDVLGGAGFMFVMYVFGSYYKLYGNKERLNTKNLMISMLCLFVILAIYTFMHLSLLGLRY